MAVDQRKRYYPEVTQTLLGDSDLTAGVCPEVMAQKEGRTRGLPGKGEWQRGNSVWGEESLVRDLKWL